MRPWVGLVIGAACAALIACAAKAPEAASPAAAPDATDAHAQIQSLDHLIESDMGRARITLPSVAECSGDGCGEALAQPYAQPSTLEAACHPAETERCGSTCTLSTSICDNQQKICNLAKRLTGDDWAVNKCQHARASCDLAHETCCTCRD